MDDAVAVLADVEQADAVLCRALAHDREQRRAGREGLLGAARRGRDGVVGRAVDQARLGRRIALVDRLLQRLGAREVVQQQAVDVQQHEAVAEIGDDVLVPDLVEQGLGHRRPQRFRLARLPARGRRLAPAFDGSSFGEQCLQPPRRRRPALVGLAQQFQRRVPRRRPGLQAPQPVGAARQQHQHRHAEQRREVRRPGVLADDDVAAIEVAREGPEARAVRRAERRHEVEALEPGRELAGVGDRKRCSSHSQPMRSRGLGGLDWPGSKSMWARGTRRSPRRGARGSSPPSSG